MMEVDEEVLRWLLRRALRRRQLEALKLLASGGPMRASELDMAVYGGHTTVVAYRLKRLGLAEVAYRRGRSSYYALTPLGRRLAELAARLGL